MEDSNQGTSNKAPDESQSVEVSCFLKIYDPNTEEVVLQQRDE